MPRERRFDPARSTNQDGAEALERQRDTAQTACTGRASNVSAVLPTIAPLHHGARRLADRERHSDGLRALNDLQSGDARNRAGVRREAECVIHVLRETISSGRGRRRERPLDHSVHSVRFGPLRSLRARGSRTSACSSGRVHERSGETRQRYRRCVSPLRSLNASPFATRARLHSHQYWTASVRSYRFCASNNAPGGKAARPGVAIHVSRETLRIPWDARRQRIGTSRCHYVSLRSLDDREGRDLNVTTLEQGRFT